MRTRLALAVAASLLAAAGLSGFAFRFTNDTFEQLRSDFVYGSLALSPVDATQAGYHKHGNVRLDQELNDFSADGLERKRSFYRDMQARISSLEKTRLAPEDRADADLMRDRTGLELLDLDVIQPYRHNPAMYVELIGNALFEPFTREYGPKTERYRDIMARLKKIPRLLEEARTNLADAPFVWNETARMEDTGNIDLIDHKLRETAPVELRQAYDEAASTGIQALQGYDSWLRSDLSKHVSDWRLGKEKYAKKFQFVLAAGKTPDEVLSEAEAELRRVQGEMAKLAAPEPVRQYLDELAWQHPAPPEFFSEAEKDLGQAIAFVRDKHLVAIPNTSNLRVIPTPEFMRGVYGVGGFSPAPALEPALRAEFWITPLPANARDAESKLREYNKFGLQHLVVHEAMPGHYLQFEYADRVQPLSRRVLRSVYGNGPYVEGWAFYVQQLLTEEGYMNGDPGFRMTFYKQCLRVITNAILDIRLQTMGMTDQQAMDLIVNQAYQEKEEAKLKLLRAKLSSAQLPMYFVGWRGWVQLRAEVKAKEGGSFRLERFHERALAQSAVPMPVLGSLLGLQ
ncbi:MAG: DUF885 domain-containing protein [Acidobacteriaceae bacterium]|nr:DUF885 domain-containing protein [Acidobacteriaceae bacterium]